MPALSGRVSDGVRAYPIYIVICGSLLAGCVQQHPPQLAETPQVLAEVAAAQQRPVELPEAQKRQVLEVRREARERSRDLPILNWIARCLPHSGDLPLIIRWIANAVAAGAVLRGWGLRVCRLRPGRAALHRRNGSALCRSTLGAVSADNREGKGMYLQRDGQTGMSSSPW